MVDSISGQSNAVQDASLLQIGQQQSTQLVEQVNVQSAKEGATLASLNLVDEATISDDAKQAYQSEKEMLRFSRLAQRVQTPYDADKVAKMKDMLDSGRINDYLRSLNTENLADSLLNSPAGAFLKD